MGVFGIALTGFAELAVERGADLIADDLGERPNVDVVGRADVQDFAVGAVVGEQLGVDALDIVDVAVVGSSISLFGLERAARASQA